LEKIGGDGVAVFRCEAKIVKRSAGRSSTAAAYRAGERIEDRRTGLVFDYGRRSGVLHSEIMAPEGAPAWVYDRAELWNRTEEAENRKDSQVAREIFLAEASELTDEQRLEVTRAYVREQFVSRGMVADIAMHAPGKEGDERNYHAHVLLTMRLTDGESFGPKERQWDKTQELEVWRAKWAEHQNRTFEKLGLAVRVDHRSLEAQGIDREPEPKLGPTVSAMERRGIDTDRGDERRGVMARNVERDELHRQYADVCRKLGLEPEPGRADPARVATKADPVRKTAHQKMAQHQIERAVKEAREEQRLKEWNEARHQAAAKANERMKRRDAGKETAKDRQDRREAMAERLRKQEQDRHRDFGREH
jgi:hypothetical protein